MKIPPRVSNLRAAVERLKKEQRVRAYGDDRSASVPQSVPRRKLDKRVLISRRKEGHQEFFNEAEYRFDQIHLKYFEIIIDLLNNELVEDESINIKKQYIKEQIKSLVSMASPLFESNEDLKDFFAGSAGFDSFEFAAANKPQLPSKAPELYKDREDRKEKPETFLERVYGPWLRGKGLFRSHIKAWDLSLYQSLYKRRDQIPAFETLLPMAQGRSVDDLARSDAELVAARRASVKKSKAKAKQRANRP